MRKLVAATAAIGALLAFSGCASSGTSETETETPSGGQSQVIDLGVVASLTGPFAGQGEAHLGSIRLGVERVNSAGGFEIDGTTYTFDLKVEDAASDPATASATVLGMIRDEGVKFLFGPGDTPTVQASESVVPGQDVVWIAGSTYISGRLEEMAGDPLYSRVFGTNPSANTVFPASVEGAMRYQPDAKSAAVVWPAGAASDPYVALIQEAFESHGVEVVEVIRYDSANSDFSSILTTLSAKHPDILYTGTTAGAVQAIAAQAIQLGVPFGSMIAFGPTAGPGLTGNSGKPLPFPYMYVMNRGLDPFANEPGVTELFEQFEAVNGQAPALDAQMYVTEFTSSVELLALGMVKAGTVDDTEAIAAALKTVSVDAGNGDVSYGENGVLKAPIGVCQVLSGEGSCELVRQ